MFNSNYRDMNPANPEFIAAGMSFETIAGNAFRSGSFDLSNHSIEEAVEARIRQHRNPSGPVEQLLANGQVIETREYPTSDGGIASIRIDISERKRYERDLKSLVEKNRQLSAAISAADIGVAIADTREGNLPVVFANRAFLEQTAPHFANPATIDLSQVFAGWATRQCDGIPIQEIHDSLAGCPGCTHEIALANDDGTGLWFALTISPIFDEAGQARSWVLMLADITERKAAEVTESRLRDQLANTQKMEAIGTLAGGIAHDFNNILAAILGNSEVALFDLPSGHRARDSIEEIKRSSLRAADLVAQILSFARQGETQAHPVRVDELAQECLRMLRAFIPATIALDVDNRSRAPVVFADETHMQRILMNLCVNASHAIGTKHGHISIRIEERSAHEADERQTYSLESSGLIPTFGTLGFARR
ncbi:MAG: PAS-domain containing protein [Acidobacteria bacterium]|nr:PAS-domain containing protein [Acidobacteriota bacterium]